MQYKEHLLENFLNSTKFSKLAKKGLSSFAATKKIQKKRKKGEQQARGPAPAKKKLFKSSCIVKETKELVKKAQTQIKQGGDAASQLLEMASMLDRLVPELNKELGQSK